MPSEVPDVQAAVKPFTFLFACTALLLCSPIMRQCAGQSPNPQKCNSTTSADKEKQVLRHAVFFKFKDSSTKKDVERVVKAFRALPAKIETIREFQSGKNVGPVGRSDQLTHCFLLTFDDEAGRAAYLPHPDHKEFGAILSPHLDKVFVIDYWGMPQSDRLEKEFKHAVFFKFKEKTPDNEVQAVEQGLADLPSHIDAIKALEWGKNNSPEPHGQGFTHCFMFTFASEDGLKEYISHPAHVAVADMLIPKMEAIRVLDFWANYAPAE